MNAEAKIRELAERQAAEAATGIDQPGRSLGTFYQRGGFVVERKEAADLIQETGIEVPNAGSGSYREFFRLLGYVEVCAFDTTSSAGDWAFAVKDKDGDWWVATQENRYPGHGFTYRVNGDRSFPDKELLIEYVIKP